MKLPVSGSGGFQQAPAATHAARCIKLIDLGTQQNEYQGAVTYKRQMIVVWELPNELMTGEHEGKPFVVSKFYTFSMHENATFRKDLQNWTGRILTDEEAAEYDVSSILDSACMLSVVHNEKGKAKITSVMGLPKGMILPPRTNPIVLFSLDAFDESVFNDFSDGLKAIIAKSPEYKLIMDCGGSESQQAPAQQDGDDGFQDDQIPF